MVDWYDYSAAALGYADDRSAATFAVAEYISSTAKANGGIARLSYADIAAHAHCSKRSVMRSVRRLENNGAILILDRGTSGNLYQPCIEIGERFNKAWRTWNDDWNRGVRRDFKLQ